MLQRQDVDAAVDADAFSRAGETGHAGVRVEVMRSGQLDVLGRHDMMLGYRNHLVTQLLRPLGEADLLGTGDRSLPRLAGRLETQHVRHRIYQDRKSTRLNSSHSCATRMPSAA